MKIIAGISTCGVGCMLALATCGLGCSASGDGSEIDRETGNPNNAGDPGPVDTGSGASTSGGSGPVDLPSSGTGGVDPDNACEVQSAQATLVTEPVDIILALDNSGSMADELEAVEQNINVNFANILTDSEVDYRVILISRHRRDVRAESGESSTSICVSAPLSGLAECAADQPVFSERFYHYSTKIESEDSFDVILATYAPPIPDEYKERFDNAPLGWSEWLRPGAKKVFLELTDANEDMAPETFVEQLTAMAPEHFGTDPQNPNFVWHTISGLAEKPEPTDPYFPDEPIVDAECTGNDNDVTNAGQAYQALSRLTGGLRFPLCQFDAYDVVFQTIANDVVTRTGIACDFAIPDPPNDATLLLDNIAVNYAPGDGSPDRQFGQAPSLVQCRNDAFYIPESGDEIVLCPEACETIQADSGANVDVLFTCESTVF